MWAWMSLSSYKCIISCHSVCYTDASSNRQCIQRCVGASDSQGTVWGVQQWDRPGGVAEPLCVHGLLAASLIFLTNSGEG